MSRLRNSMKRLLCEIKKYRNTDRVVSRFFPAFLFSYWVSPYLALIAVKTKTIPNIVTLCMIPVSILGSILFSLECIPCKIIGTVLIHIWFSIDIADGLVARYTNNFSKYGEELDFMAHHICHIFFIVSFAINIFNNRYELLGHFFSYEIECFLLLSTMIWVEYSFRNECSIDALMKTRNGENREKKNVKTIKPNFFRRTVRSVINCFNCIDNYVLMGSLVVYCDLLFHTEMLLLITIALVLLTLLYNVKFCISKIKIMIKG